MDTLSIVAEPGPRSRSRFNTDLVWLGCQFAITMGLVGVVGPWMEVLYESSDVPVPVLTVAAFDLSHSFMTSWPIWPTLAAFLLWHFSKRGLGRRPTVVGAIGIGAFWLIYGIGLLIPLLTWIDPP